MAAERIDILARGVIVVAGHVLVCRALDAAGSPRYAYLPGGHVEPGESAADAVARELLEEAGLAVEVGACVHVHEQRFSQRKKNQAKKSGTVERHEYTLTFLARIRPAVANVFHVEHPPTVLPSTTPTTPAAPRPQLPPVASLEPHIDFAWLPLDGIAAAHSSAVALRPDAHARWLALHAPALTRGDTPPTTIATERAPAHPNAPA
jgi:8-oxo-dGTP pyrophosphatase MutT (NUDIX family)